MLLRCALGLNSSDPTQVLLRGCILRNTQHVYGAVIFAGHETKAGQAQTICLGLRIHYLLSHGNACNNMRDHTHIGHHPFFDPQVMMNSTAVPSKRSRLERRLDLLIAAIFAMQFAICLVGAIGSAVWVDSSHWYLNLGSEHEPSSSRALFDPSNRGLVAVLTFMTLVTLYSSIIPISLYVSIEIIKYSQAVFFINQDVDMYDEATGTPASARTSNLVNARGAAPSLASAWGCF